MVQVGLMKELPAIPDDTGEESWFEHFHAKLLEASVLLQVRADVERLKLSQLKSTSNISSTWLPYNISQIVKQSFQSIQRTRFHCSQIKDIMLTFGYKFWGFFSLFMWIIDIFVCLQLNSSKFSVLFHLDSKAQTCLHLGEILLQPQINLDWP